MGTPVALPDVPGGRLNCLSYTPFEPGDIGATTPGWASSARIGDDLRRLAAYTDCLRVYTPLGNTPRVVEAAQREWVSTSCWAPGSAPISSRTRGRFERPWQLARRYPQAISCHRRRQRSAAAP